MADLIERQAAIEAVGDWIYNPEDLRYHKDVINSIPAAQLDHTADVSKKVSISCAHENDVIFREAAIEALARMMPRSYTPDGSHPADEEIFRAQEVFADCIEALEILPSAQPEPHWVPCSERLPEERGFYLTTTKDKAVYCDHWNEDNFDRTEMVIAWMPLPEPYKGGDSE